MLGRPFAPWLAVFALACSSAGPYGYSRTYSPLSEEEDAVEDAREFDPVMAQRDVKDWQKGKIRLFGVVKARKQAPGGRAYLTLSMRILEERNLCDEFDEETCRVTVSEREHAVVHSIVTLTGADDIGKNAVQYGSLLRVVGRLGDDVDADDGGAILLGSYYRHWPRDEYVTTADREHMRK